MRKIVAAMLLALPLFAEPARVIGIVEKEATLGRPLTLLVAGDPGPCASLVLFVQGSPIEGLPAKCSPGKVSFVLNVTEANAERWHRILGGHGTHREVIVSAGAGAQFPLPTEVYVPFRIIDPKRAAMIVVAAIILFVVILGVRKFTSALDAFARVLVALWIVIIGVSYAYIWAVTNELQTINTSALGLIGIGLGTAAGASLIGNMKNVDAKTLVQTVISEAQDGHLTPTEKGAPQGLHALQNAAWMGVLAIVFVIHVWQKLEMPQLHGNVLTLLGITGGTYAAFAMPRRN
jgi:hypothetical protein